MSSVFANPGTPTMRQLPPAYSAVSDCSITSSCPMISFRNSLMIWSRPRRSLSASATSSGASSATRSWTCVATCALRSVCHGVDHVVRHDLVRLVGKVDGSVRLVRELHQFAEVGVVVGDGNQSLGRVVVLEHAVPMRRLAVSGRQLAAPDIVE